MLWMQIQKNQYITNRGNTKLNQSIEFKVQLLQIGLNGLFTAAYNKKWVNALQTLIFLSICLEWDTMGSQGIRYILQPGRDKV